jgi:TetR/AcrR family transcriptional regulator, tetracycline repressor protein
MASERERPSEADGERPSGADGERPSGADGERPSGARRELASGAERRTPGQRAGLTREAVMTAARAALAQDGVEGLSMRRIARRLGVAPNALYSHVADRDDLVDALLDDTLNEVEAPDPERGDWRRGIETMMRRTYDVLLAHPDLVPLYVARRGARGPRAVALGEAMLRMLFRGGIEGDAATEAMRTLIVHTIGFAAFATGDALPPGQSALPPKALDQLFARSLRWLLDGIATDGARRRSPDATESGSAARRRSRRS